MVESKRLYSVLSALIFGACLFKLAMWILKPNWYLAFEASTWGSVRQATELVVVLSCVAVGLILQRRRDQSPR